ncbi:protein of unknown function [Pseudomonas mediterranea]
MPATDTSRQPSALDSKGAFVCAAEDSLWEQLSYLAAHHRYREQARSHRGLAVKRGKWVHREQCGSEPARDSGGPACITTLGFRAFTHFAA